MRQSVSNDDCQTGTNARWLELSHGPCHHSAMPQALSAFHNAQNRWLELLSSKHGTPTKLRCECCWSNAEDMEISCNSVCLRFLRNVLLRHKGTRYQLCVHPCP